MRNLYGTISDSYVQTNNPIKTPVGTFWWVGEGKKCLVCFICVEHTCQTQAREANLARSAIIFGPQDHIKHCSISGFFFFVGLKKKKDLH